MSTVLLIGKHGQVTTYLQRELRDGYKLSVASRDVLDLSKRSSIRSVLERLAPTVIINPAAFTAVDLAEEEQEAAFAVNRDAAGEIAEYCASTNTPLIHFSTDYVFSGDATTPYTEHDSPAPTGVYGQSKLEGEKAVLASDAPAIILRTSWVYSNHGKNFYKTMLTLAESRDKLSVVSDQIGAPTYAGSIAKACREILDIVLEQGGVNPEQKGVYHLTCSGQTSWSGFATEIFNLNGLTRMTVDGIPSSEYPTPTKRPAYSVLDNTKLLATFGVSLPHWQDALADCVNESKV